MKKASKLLLTSVLTIALCISLIAGATFALFTDDDSVNITVSSGKVDVSASIGDIVTHSYVEQTDGSYKQEEMKDEMAGKFAMGGEAYETDTGIVIDNILPGDKVTFNIVITNASTVTVKYQTSVSIGKITVDGKKVDSHMGLFQALDITLGDDLLVASGLTSAKLSNWTTLPVGTTEVPVTVELPYSYDDNSSDADSIQGQKCALDFTVTAVQGNAQTYDPAVANPDFDGENINTVGDLMAFRDMVNGGDTYSGQTVTLKADLDLGGIDNWEPIGTTANPFMGTFDGQGHTVSGMTIETSDGSKSLGLFGEIKNATITHVKVSGSIKSTAVIQSYSSYPSSETYPIGGICGYATSSTITLCTNAVNIDVSEATTVDEFSSVFVGGILGYANSLTSHKFENCLNEGNIILPAQDVTCMAGGITSSAYKFFPIDYVVNVGKLIGNESDFHYVGEIAGQYGGQDMSTWYSTNSANLIAPQTDEDGLLDSLSDHYVSGAIVKDSFGALDFDNIWTIIAGKLAIK